MCFVYMQRRSVNSPAAYLCFVVLLATRYRSGEYARRMLKLTLSLLPQKYAVCRLDPNGPIPYWALLGDDFISLTRTKAELSVVCLQENVPADIKAARGWRCARVEGPFDLDLPGVHVSLAIPLAQAGISILAIATYETDHLLISEEDLVHAIRVLEEVGHRFIA